MQDELLSIGRFARLAGLSIGALRHYHELGLLAPATIDRASGYRRYRAAQLVDARLIAALRDLDVPLALVRAVLCAGPAERRELLEGHRSTLLAERDRLTRRLHRLNRAIDHEDPIMSVTTHPVHLADRRQLAVDLFNHVWTLLERSDRTQLDDDEMLHAAHASRFHWGEIGEPVNLARGEWQCSRVYSVLRRGEPAMWHARRCVSLCEEHGIGDWDIAFAWEAVARAASVAGQDGEARSALDRARTLAAAVADDEDRDLVLSDLATIDSRP